MNSKDSVDMAVSLTERLLREQQMIFDRAWAENGALVYPALSALGRFDGELCCCNHRGEPIWCRVTASWVHAENPDEGAVCLMEDVTLARAASIALQESEARFVPLFDQSPMPMGYSSSSDGFSSTNWNGAWFETLGFDRSAGPLWDHW